MSDEPANKKLKTESNPIPITTTPSTASTTTSSSINVTKKEETISLSAALAQADKKLDDETLRGMAKGNINISSAASEVHQLSESSQADKARHEELLKQLEAKKKARSITVPTNDNLVKKKLREMGEPITIFGERAPGRRERLHALLARLAVEGTTVTPTTTTTTVDTVKSEPEPNKAFLTEGLEELKDARINITKFSLPRAKTRILNEMEMIEQRKQDPEGATRDSLLKQESLKRQTQYIPHSSQIGDIRPISSCMFAPNGKQLATSSWTGTCKLWEIPSGRHTATLKGHEERCTDIAWHPKATLDQSPSAVNLATCAADGSVLLWPLESKPSTIPSSSPEPIITPLTTLSNHTDRCSRVAFHPSGEYLASTSFDRTWRLWDIEKQMEILMQVGHSRGTYGLAFQQDGALIATGDLGGNGLVWDLRTGKTIYPLVGHAKQVLAIDFAPTGYHLATGSSDHTVRIWDLRQRCCLYVIPAHNSLVSNVRYQPEGGYLLTSGYDCTAKIYHSTDFHLMKTLSGHEGKVMRAEISPDSEYIATASFDRTWKLWQQEK